VRDGVVVFIEAQIELAVEIGEGAEGAGGEERFPEVADTMLDTSFFVTAGDGDGLAGAASAAVHPGNVGDVVQSPAFVPLVRCLRSNNPFGKGSDAERGGGREH
jgi:hypothetical protein